ncbi:hypothetical protein F5X68DRAFT_261408 [Plectosphaerella plurivora]|uniref:Exonuclease domain-containing protein n=1 Tax=Plectosphaerella plurivora TaxID=936078 RepID=A0A9P9AAA8_9PEZI|nr:hypothetical protein F5X68DRAFT_261408 [Plectosphaerella plurivora]
MLGRRAVALRITGRQAVWYQAQKLPWSRGGTRFPTSVSLLTRGHPHIHHSGPQDVDIVEVEKKAKEEHMLSEELERQSKEKKKLLARVKAAEKAEKAADERFQSRRPAFLTQRKATPAAVSPTKEEVIVAERQKRRAALLKKQEEEAKAAKARAGLPVAEPKAAAVTPPPKAEPPAPLPTRPAPNQHLRSFGNKWWELSDKEKRKLDLILLGPGHPEELLLAAEFPLKTLPAVYERSAKEARRNTTIDIAEREHLSAGGVIKSRMCKKRLLEFETCPERDRTAPKSRAIVLDCEFANGRMKSDRVLSQISIIDFVSGVILHESLVQSPELGKKYIERKLLDYRMTRKEQYHEKPNVLPDWKAAREMVFKFADKETFIMGHGLENDLNILHIMHDKILDSAILTLPIDVLAPGSLHNPWGLVFLCKRLLGIDFRVTRDPDSGRELHDPLEDNLVAREIILTCLLQPDRLKNKNWQLGSKAMHYERLQMYMKQLLDQERMDGQPRTRAKREVSRTLKNTAEEIRKLDPDWTPDAALRHEGGGLVKAAAAKKVSKDLTTTTRVSKGLAAAAQVSKDLAENVEDLADKDLVKDIEGLLDQDLFEDENEFPRYEWEGLGQAMYDQQLLYDQQLYDQQPVYDQIPLMEGEQLYDQVPPLEGEQIYDQFIPMEGQQIYDQVFPTQGEQIYDQVLPVEGEQIYDQAFPMEDTTVYDDALQQPIDDQAFLLEHGDAHEQVLPEEGEQIHEQDVLTEDSPAEDTTVSGKPPQVVGEEDEARRG